MTIRRKSIENIIIGCGQSGLAMSYYLTQKDRDHIILEKNHQIGASWQHRWDSFTLVTPNWQLQLPGFPYQGEEPDAFSTRDEVIHYLETYASTFNPPIQFGTTVSSVTQNENGQGFLVETSNQVYIAQNVIVAVGIFQSPKKPSFSRKIPAHIQQIHSSEYKNSAQLPEGAVLVVGSGQSGSQIAQELNENGRKVYLSTGKAGRLPRRYRSKDGMWWAVKLGITDQTVDDLESKEERFGANPQISGKNGGQDINLHQFVRDGITLLGRFEDVRDQRAIFGSDLHSNLTFADKFAEQFRHGVDQFIQKSGLDLPQEKVNEPKDGYDLDIIPHLDFAKTDIHTVLWATGYQWDYSWIKLPVFDEYGYPEQRRGVTEYDGLYFLGLHWLHKLKSGLFLGVGEDAEYLAAYMENHS